MGSGKGLFAEGAPEGNVNREAKASKKLEDWLKSSRMRSF